MQREKGSRRKTKTLIAVNRAACRTKPRSRRTAVAPHVATPQSIHQIEPPVLRLQPSPPRSDYESGDETPVGNDGEQVAWRYKRSGLIGVFHRINSSSRDGIVNDISSVLERIGPECLQKFEKCVFGRLLKLPKNIVRSNQCIHYVISREVVLETNPDPTVLSYRINDQNIRFSRYEFALVTGLRFGGSNFHPYQDHQIPENSVYTRIFKNQPITPDKLREKFNDDRGLDGATNDDYVKIAKVLFVYCMLIAKDCSRTTIADWVWCLVEDTKAWENFPWGSFSYQILLQYLKNIKTSLKDSRVQQYHFYGFVTAFLGWIFCAIEHFGNQCKVTNGANRLPRILRYAFNNTPLDMENVQGNIHVTLEPSERELTRRYWTQIEPTSLPFLFQYNHKYEGQQIRALKKQGASSLKPPIQEVGTADEDADQEAEEGHNEHVQMPSPQPRKSSRSSHHHEGQQIRALKKRASCSRPTIQEVRTTDEGADQEEEEGHNEHVQMPSPQPCKSSRSSHHHEGQQIRALKKRASCSRPTIQEVRTTDEGADQEEEEGHNEHVQMPSPQPRKSGRSSHHETGTSTHHSDPQQMFSFTWDQRRSFLQEVGNYAAQRAKEEFDAQKKAWTEEVGSYAATKVKEELEHQRPHIVRELGDYVLGQLGDIFPGYSDYMAQRSQRAEEDFADWNLTMSQPIPENEMATQDNPNWTQTMPTEGSLWRTGLERQWPSETRNLKDTKLARNQTKEADCCFEKSFQAE